MGLANSEKTAAKNAIGGYCAPRFEAVRDAFADNFDIRSEVGAAVCVYERGRPVVDLWGGYRDAQRDIVWSGDTIVTMHSVGKGFTTLSALMLADRGQLDLAAPVARYWPRFGQAGKAAITVEQLLGGMAALVFLDHAAPGAYYDQAAMAEAIERQAPNWQPGSRGAYHSATYGHLIDELVRRVDGRSAKQFLAEEIAGPLAADFIGAMSDADLARVADVISNPQNTTSNDVVQTETPLGRAWRVLPGARDFNSPEFRRHVSPSGGHGNARGVARIYAALANGGELDGINLLSPAMIARARTPQWEGPCGLTGRDFRYALGFFLSNPAAYMGPNPNCFGHPGMGGAVGFADPDYGIAFSYSPNFLCAGATLGERCAALVDATYACLA